MLARIALIVAALSLWTGASAEEPLSPAMKTLVTELAAATYTVGLCEQYMPTADATEILAPLLAPATRDTAIATEITAVYASTYIAGRRDAATRSLDVAQCSNLLKKSREAVRAAHTAAER